MSTAASADALERRDAAEYNPAAGYRVAEYELVERARAADRQVALTDGFPVPDMWTTVGAAGSRPDE
jgi:hypothetical protein